MAIFCCFKTCFKSFILISPKWKILAAKAPVALVSLKTSVKSSIFPAPPEAIMGILTICEISLSNLTSKPCLVPSKSMEVSKISPAPNSSTFFCPIMGFIVCFYSSAVHKNVIFVSKLFRIYRHHYTLTAEFIGKSFN